jgi:hypothetical protein
MAVTISRLYDRYADAERAVTALETASRTRTSALSRTIQTIGTVARKIAITTVSMTVRKALAKELELAPA